MNELGDLIKGGIQLGIAAIIALFLVWRLMRVIEKATDRFLRAYEKHAEEFVEQGKQLAMQTALLLSISERMGINAPVVVNVDSQSKGKEESKNA